VTLDLRGEASVTFAAVATGKVTLGRSTAASVTFSVARHP
jgi:hypothetical protein